MLILTKIQKYLFRCIISGCLLVRGSFNIRLITIPKVKVNYTTIYSQLSSVHLTIFIRSIVLETYVNLTDVLCFIYQQKIFLANRMKMDNTMARLLRTCHGPWSTSNRIFFSDFHIFTHIRIFPIRLVLYTHTHTHISICPMLCHYKINNS